MKAEQVVQVCRLMATAASRPVVIETVGSRAGVEHRLAVPTPQADSVADQLRATIAGIALEGIGQRPSIRASRAVELRLSTRRRSLRSDDAAGVSRALLTALAQVRGGEQVSIQWVLGRSFVPVAVPNELDSAAHETWTRALLLAPFSPPRPTDAEMRNALRVKRAEPGWQAVGRVAVQAATTGRARQLIRQVVGALRSAEAPGVSFWVRPTNTQRVMKAAPSWWMPLRLNAVELATVSAWPVGVTSELPVSMIGSRLVAPSSAIARRGRVLATATFPGRERPLALMPTDALRHLHALGPTGSGKSTLL
ncbi:MAG: hypothetical protein ABR992_16985, partial [Solirubrobacteraceae bacterium]